MLSRWLTAECSAERVGAPPPAAPRAEQRPRRAKPAGEDTMHIYVVMKDWARRYLAGGSSGLDDGAAQSGDECASLEDVAPVDLSQRARHA